MRSRFTRPAMLAVTALLVPALAACGGGGGSKKVKVPSDAVAVVDSTPILKTDFDHLLGIALASYKAQSQTPPKVGTADYESLKQRAMLVLLQRIALAQEAKKEGVKADPKEVATKLAQAKQQAGGDAAWQKSLKTAAATEADYKQLFELQILGQGLYDKVTKSVAVTDADLQKYYDAHKSSYTHPKSRKVEHILLGKKNANDTTKPTAKQYAQFLSQAESVLAQLKAGAKFATLVTKYSTDPGKTTNKGIYDVTPTGFDPAFTKASFALKTGAYTTTPVKSSFGYHIIEALADVAPAGTDSFDKVKAQIKSQLVNDKKQQAGQTWFDQLMKRYTALATFAPGYSLPKSTSGTTSTATATGAATTG
jgi:parvulin-like peptidyl-prolyl isomerase